MEQEEEGMMQGRKQCLKMTVEVKVILLLNVIHLRLAVTDHQCSFVQNQMVLIGERRDFFGWLTHSVPPICQKLALCLKIAVPHMDKR